MHSSSRIFAAHCYARLFTKTRFSRSSVRGNTAGWRALGSRPLGLSSACLGLANRETGIMSPPSYLLTVGNWRASGLLRAYTSPSGRISSRCCSESHSPTFVTGARSKVRDGNARDAPVGNPRRVFARLLNKIAYKYKGVIIT